MRPESVMALRLFALLSEARLAWACHISASFQPARLRAVHDTCQAFVPGISSGDELHRGMVISFWSSDHLRPLGEAAAGITPDYILIARLATARAASFM